MFFEVLYSADHIGPRAGKISTLFGEVETPCFLPIASNGSFRSLSVQQVNELNSEIIMMNAWHVYRKYGKDNLQAAGGIHKLLGWQKNICSDSGGYQIFSLEAQSKLSTEGVSFTDIEEGELTPRKVIEMQKYLGSNIMYSLDDCAPHPCTRERALLAVERTTKWGIESIDAHDSIPSKYGHDQYLYGIVQGSVFKELRIQSAKEMSDLNFDGFGIGGLSIGMTQDHISRMTILTCEHLPYNKPRHLLGVGLPIQILIGIANGVDTFDCVLPLRKASRGVAYTYFGEVKYKHEQKGRQKSIPLDKKCTCSTCNSYSREDLRQLYKKNKDKAGELVSVHNLFFYNEIMKSAREAILLNEFQKYFKDFVSRWKAGGGDIPK